MQGKVERTYGKIFTYVKIFANPLKKTIITTECQIHKMINEQALEIIKNDNFPDAHYFFSDYLKEINNGTVWADQDFKSSGHFYSPISGRGLFGNDNAMSLAKKYYTEALNNWHNGSVEESMFFLGACLHIVQDMTVPQHANIKLLSSHRQFENFIKRTYLNTPNFYVYNGGYYIDSIEEAVSCNARTAIKIHTKLKDIEDNKKRYYTIAKFVLPLAQKTTAGCLIRFFKDVSKPNLQ